jgi:hypothetical protein
MRCWKVGLISYFMFLSMGLAQQIKIDLQLSVPDARIFYAGDLGYTGMGNIPEIYDVVLANTASSSQNMRLHFEMHVGNTIVVETFSNPFTLPVGTFMFGSRQLKNGLAFIPETGEYIELKRYSIDFNRVENLRKQVAATGRLPSGQYNFFMEAILLDENSQPTGQIIPDTDPDNNILTVTNPTTLELVYPGSRAEDEAVEEIPSQFPYFIWQSDASLFNLFVFEKYAMDRSVEDVINHDPVLQLEGFPNQIFQYPADPGKLEFFKAQGEKVGESVGPIRLLEQGKIYYWYVEAVVLSTSGEIHINSRVFKFKIVNQEQGDSATKLIRIYLEQMLGRRYTSYLQRLQDSTPTGKMVLNNVPVGVEALIDLVNKIKNDEITIQNVSIE